MKKFSSIILLFVVGVLIFAWVRMSEKRPLFTLSGTRNFFSDRSLEPMERALPSLSSPLTPSKGESEIEETPITTLPPTTLEGVVNVRAIGTFSAKGDNVSDDTGAFNEAIRLASTSSQKSYKGPTGSMQGVVYVPVGTYRIKDVLLRNNVRIEIDAGATLKQYAPTRVDKNGVGLFDFGDRDSAVSVDNVSVVGVGTSATYDGKQKPTPQAGWDITHSFTIVTDPVATNASQFLKPFSIRFANGILIQNVFSVGNNSDTSDKTPGGVNSEERVISTGVRGDASGAASTYYGPTNLTIDNLYAVGGHGGGGGAIQIQAGRNVVVRNVFSEGGVAARFESDGVGNDTLTAHSCVKQGAGGGGAGCTCSAEAPCALMYISDIKNVSVDHVVCKDGQAAVTLVPHNQRNSSITLSNITGENCENVILTGNTGDKRLTPGSFAGVTINNLRAIGSNYLGSGLRAQISKSTQKNNWSWTHGLASVPLCVKEPSVIEPLTIGSCQVVGGDFSSGTMCDSSLALRCK